MDPLKLRQARQKVGNTFALTVLLQKRCQELVRGAKRLVEEDIKNPIDLALEEIVQGRVWLSETGELHQAAVTA
jgi:DNA-directed RNA polymerase subunit K/omega